MDDAPQPSLSPTATSEVAAPAVVAEAEHELIYGLEDRPPFREAVFAAIQHVLACFVGIITPSLSALSRHL